MLLLYEVVLTFWMVSKWMTIQMKATKQYFTQIQLIDENLKCDHSATEQYFHVVSLIVQYKMVPTFEFVKKKIKESHHSVGS